MPARPVMLGVSALLLLPVLLSPALAQMPGGGPGGPRAPQPRVFLIALDLDGDGQLSAAEIDAASQSLLKALDKNHDGQITSDEYSPHIAANSQTAPPMSNALYARLIEFDKNKDGELTKDELPERMWPMFERGDANHDGKLTGDEIRAMAAASADPQGRAAGRGNAPVNLRTDPVTEAIDVDHDGVFSAAEIASAPGALKALDKNADGMLSADELKVRAQTPRERAAHNLDEMDGDRDGFIEKSEWQSRGGGTFEEVDTNHDGKVDLEELTAAMAMQPAQGPPRPGGVGGGERPGDRTPPTERMPENNASPDGGTPR